MRFHREDWMFNAHSVEKWRDSNKPGLLYRLKVEKSSGWVFYKEYFSSKGEAKRKGDMLISKGKIKCYKVISLI